MRRDLRRRVLPRGERYWIYCGAGHRGAFGALVAHRGVPGLHVGDLFEGRELASADLERMIAGLDRAEWVNPIGPERYAAAAVIHRAGFERHLEFSAELDAPFVRERLRGWLAARRGDRARAEVKREETRAPWRRMKFVPIAPGELLMGEVGKGVLTKISEPLEAGDTAVTQWQYARGMRGDNPSHFARGPNEVTVKFPDGTRTFQVDNPVEQVSWDDATSFVHRVHALDASSDPLDQALLREIIPDHRKGDHYALFLDARWEFVVRNRGAANGTYAYGDDESQLARYGCVLRRSLARLGSVNP